MKESTPTGAAMLRVAERYLAQGQFSQAEAVCRQVLAANPRNVEAMLLLANLQNRLDRHDQAERFLRAALTFEPENPLVLVELARLFRKVRRQDLAIEYCRSAIKAAPDHADAHFVLGICCIDVWHIQEAIQALETAVELEPGRATAYDRLGFALQMWGRNRDAIDSYRRAIEIDPNLLNAQINLSHVLQREGQIDDSAAIFETALARSSHSVSSLSVLGRALRAQGANDRAEGVLRAADMKANGAATQRMPLVQFLEETGSFEEARSLLNEAAVHQPEDAGILHELVYSNQMTESDRELARRIGRLLERRSLNPKDRVRLLYALGKFHDDLGEYERAFPYFEKANEVARTHIHPAVSSRSDHTKLIDAIIARFQPELFKSFRGSGSTSAEPLFILGMPRSGTTLTEQILSSHSDIGAVGESLYFSCRGFDVIDPRYTICKEALEDLYEGYLWHVRAITQGESRIADKMPFNYMFAGLINLLFPNARIINCRRHPLDNCLSIYVTPVEFDFSNSLSDIAFYHHEYQRLMVHWRRVLPEDRFLEIDYEDLVTNEEPVARRMLEFVGVPWSASVLDFTANRQSIQTASFWQARQPLHSKSIERWRRYEPWIDALLIEFPEYISKRGRSVLL